MHHSQKITENSLFIEKIGYKLKRQKHKLDSNIASNTLNLNVTTELYIAIFLFYFLLQQEYILQNLPPL